jgi:hypothetical protein
VATNADSGAAKGPWDCVFNPPEQPTLANVSVSILVNNAIDPTVTASQVDGGSGLDTVESTPFAGAQVQVCPTLVDPACTNSTGQQLTDDAGLATFSLPDNFNGFFLVTRPDLVQFNLYLGNLPVGVTSQTFPLGDLSKSGVEGVALAVPGQNVAPSIGPDAGEITDGMIFFDVYDCNDVYAAGVSVSLVSPGQNTFEYYATTSDFLSITDSYTTAVAAGGFMNVPVGSATLKAEIAVGPLAGTQLGSITVPVAAGVIDEVLFRERTH